MDYTVDTLEDMAMRQEPVPDMRSQAKILLYQSFRNLYWYARQYGLSQEQGKQEKQRILDSYRINSFLEELNEQTSAMWKRIELASCDYRKAPSVDKADALLEAIYNVKRKLPKEGGAASEP